MKKISEVMPSIEDLRDNIKEITEPPSLLDAITLGDEPKTEFTLVGSGDRSKLVPGIEYYKAMLKSQMEFPDVGKSKTRYDGSKYSTLEDILKAVIPILNANGIHVEQDITYNEQKAQCIITRLTHASSGQGSEFMTLIPFDPADFDGKIAFQVYGTGFTYFKKYVLGAKFCLYTDEDTDGVTASKKYEPAAKPKQSKIADSGSGSSYFNN